MAGAVFSVEGTTADGKKVRLNVTLKKFCNCKVSDCVEEAKVLAEEKLKKVLKGFKTEELFWLDNKVNPNFFVKVMEVITEVLETVCITVRSNHLQGADLKVEILNS